MGDVRPGYEQDEITVRFGTGSITGHCFKDSICLGSACTDGAFIASTDESAQPFSVFDFDGVLGLGLPGMAQGPVFSLMQRLAESKALRSPIFSVFLSNSDNETSEITFGDTKADHMASELFWVPITGSQGYWEILIDDIIVGHDAKGLCSETGCRVAVDTGTSQLAGPSSLVDAISGLLGVRTD